MQVILIEDDQLMINKIKSTTNQLFIYNSFNLAEVMIRSSNYDLLIIDYELNHKIIDYILELVIELDIQSKVVMVFKTPKMLKKCYKKYLLLNMNVSKINSLLESYAPKNDIDKIIASLSVLGISSHLRGYHYIKEAIMMIQNNEFVSITKDIYPCIAKMYKTTSSAVERAIRHAIEVGWQLGDIDFMDKAFHNILSYDQDRPTNSQYIYSLLEYLKRVP